MVSIRKIAEEANVSPGTVSRVLNRDPTLSVTAQTRYKIEMIAKRLNYSKLTRKVPLTIALLATMDLDEATSNIYYQHVKQGIIGELKRIGARLGPTVYLSSAITQQASDSIKYADGVIVIGGLTRNGLEHVLQLNNHAVVIDDRYESIQVDRVNADSANGAKQALAHLDEWAKGDIVYVGGKRYVTDLDGTKTKTDDEIRLKTYQAWMQAHTGKDGKAILVGWDCNAGYEAAKRLAGLPNLPKGILAGNDTLAMGVMRGLHEAGYHAPKDYHIIGFDDIQESQYFIPRLSSVHIPEDELGRTAVHAVQARLNKWRSATSTNLLSVELKLRESTGDEHYDRQRDDKEEKVE
ncbi:MULTISPECIES: LacI family DNA-binding transcriptional regulator [Lacticaseibacillus]|uniref:LacI family DNA-binding transcriptional regulator n=2 Tax=Lacticaseibacillus TaxID=2759736 RepID=A0AAN1F0U8_LACCA|nr:MULTISPECIES: LacI family DNA-binding transcriptional regulator [Lacticaseibacillus]ARY92702.1 hypothetical protein BGL52_13420 [Lacticaseibacillus casei]WLV80605.1 LacI family DNA-binding transcriptional regulator [Lacticaseibacillus sp. NCIMB 15473]WNX24565.1 LacI family DNA-binding transcriptional regulator [Lacticaseibacillus casei]WNX27337.1 LacI family DNA-binding transcriptional regulator [Lacticaseibacillus casei]